MTHGCLLTGVAALEQELALLRQRAVHVHERYLDIMHLMCENPSVACNQRG
jgi:hypothetical protein